jgi:hypothetical protein
MPTEHRSIDEAFHAVFAIMPPHWRFKALYLASKPAYKRRVGFWYAQAVGPDPYLHHTGYGLTGEGRDQGAALRDLAAKLEDLEGQFRSAGGWYDESPG